MFFITLQIAKLISLVSRTFRVGAGYTLPAHIALKIFPRIKKKMFSRLPKNLVLITGTNGKTTTSKLLTYFLEQDGQKVLHNSSGANLLNGILSCLIVNSDFWGRLKYDTAVLEVDELFFPVLLEILHFSKYDMSQAHVLLLNVTRDQLDRHFEPDIVLEKWKKAITEYAPLANLYFDTTQEYFIPMAESLPKNTIRFFDDNPVYLHKSTLRGIHNAKNINAALLVVPYLNASVEISVSVLPQFEHAYGRGEVIDYKGTKFMIYLAKNPSSYNNNLNTLLDDGLKEYKSILFILNDNIPDGRDVSWIYDITPSLLSEICKNRKVFVTGTRYLEMAIRLDYAGVYVDKANLFNNVKSAVSVLSKNESITNVIALPNYSAMLKLRKVLTGRKIL